MKATRCYCGKVTVEQDGVIESMTCLEFLRKFVLQPIPPRTERHCPVCTPRIISQLPDDTTPRVA